MIKRFRDLGFTGPHSGGKHPFMMRGTHTVAIPNPHPKNKEIPNWFLKDILEQAGVSEQEWLGT